VLLKDVNYFEDENGNPLPETLQTLFQACVKYGINPYYVFFPDPQQWTLHFIPSIQKVQAMWLTMRRDASGIAARARLVIDVPNENGEARFGKVPMAEGIMSKDSLSDYFGNSYSFKTR
jgi:L-lysine 2,3-aminomutase